jgi:predicted AAA+ superfamily ATPase
MPTKTTSCEPLSRIFAEPKDSFFFLGPRGTGKSTLLKARYKNALYIDLLNPQTLHHYLARPEYLYEVINAQPRKKIVIIDEVQKAPTLLSVVHDLIEKKLGLTFILTGSSARKLKRTDANLLGGRALKQTLHPFMAIELGKKFSLEKALHNGMLPLIFNAKNPHDSLYAYIDLYLRGEVQAEGFVRNIEGFSRFLEAISFSHASLINTTNIARECAVKRKTVENYITILEDLLLGFHLTIFAKRAQRELSAHPKFYLFDAGVFSTLRPKGVLDSTTDVEGAALEGLVAQHLRAWNDYSTSKHALHFWRTRSGVEVDFVIYGPTEFWAIEVKNAKRVFPNDSKSLETFLQDYPAAKAILLYRGKELLRQKNVLCIPCDMFLAQLKPNQTLWQD